MKKNILVFALLIFSSHLQAAMITWNSINNTYNQNDIFTLDVIGTDFVSNVDGGGVDITYNSSVLNVLSITIDELVWDFAVSPGIIDNGAGTVNGLYVNAFSPVTGDFTVASIEFQVIGTTGSNSALTLTEYALNPWASGGLPINPSYTNGNVSVVPVPAAAWLFASGLIALVSVARQNRQEI